MKEEIKKNKFSILIKEEWCKGCAICVEFCPEKVLAMDGNKVKIVDLGACKGCTICELMCPDFAISVVRSDRK